MTISLPQDRQALIDKDFRVTIPYRRWMNDVTKALMSKAATTTETQTINFPTFTGTGWIKVTGSYESGNISIGLRDGITTDDLPEGETNLYCTGGRGEILVTGAVGPVALTTNDETDWLYA